MAKKTIELMVCDGCSGELRSHDDGLVFNGSVTVSGPNPKSIVGGSGGALCWKCWHKAVHDPVLAEARRGDAAYLDTLYRERPGGGPSGPLPPPEIRAVGVVDSLCGAKRR